MSDKHTRLSLEQLRDYQFRVDFGEGSASLFTDEPAPLGEGAGPNPVQMLATAVGNCLSASLLFALRKFKQDGEPLRTDVEAHVGRNDKGRLRVLEIAVHIHLGVPAVQIEHLARILAQFEGFCTVTQSVAQGLPVRLTVSDSTGSVQHQSRLHDAP